MLGPKTTGETHDRPPRCSHPTEDTTYEQEAAPPVGEQDAHVGVQKVQAALRIYGRYARWCLFIGCAHFLVNRPATGGSCRPLLFAVTASVFIWLIFTI